MLARDSAAYEAEAYLNWILLDEEQFKLVEGGYEQESFFKQASGDACSQFTPLLANNGEGINVTKNGYLYIYVSNTNRNYPVYFDDLHIVHTKSSLMEETHYYPFGLTMAGISSKAAKGTGYLENKRKFNSGTELNTDFDISIYETPFRGYDPQIGRFTTIDKLASMFESSSPYVFACNNPIMVNDPTGLADSTTQAGFENSKGGAKADLGNVTVTSSKKQSIGLDLYPYLSKNLSYFKGQQWGIATPQNTQWYSLTSQWALQYGQSNLVFKPGHSMTEGMKSSYKVGEARDYFYKKYLNRFLSNSLSKGRPAMVTNYRGDFGLPEVLNAGCNTAQQFVGSYGVNIYLNPDSQQLIFVLSNTTSVESLLYGIGPEYERSSGIVGGNTRQLYIWSEPLNYNSYFERQKTQEFPAHQSDMIFDRYNF